MRDFIDDILLKNSKDCTCDICEGYEQESHGVWFWVVAFVFAIIAFLGAGYIETVFNGL